MTSVFQTCKSCSQRFSSGFKRSPSICGVCQPIDNGIDWGAVPNLRELDGPEAPTAGVGIRPHAPGEGGEPDVATAYAHPADVYRSYTRPEVYPS